MSSFDWVPLFSGCFGIVASVNLWTIPRFENWWRDHLPSALGFLYPIIRYLGLADLETGWLTAFFRILLPLFSLLFIVHFFLKLFGWCGGPVVC